MNGLRSGLAMNEKSSSNTKWIWISQKELEQLVKDIKWYLAIHGWEYMDEAIEKSEKVKERLWKFVFKYEGKSTN